MIYVRCGVAFSPVSLPVKLGDSKPRPLPLHSLIGVTAAPSQLFIHCALSLHVTTTHPPSRPEPRSVNSAAMLIMTCGGLRFSVDREPAFTSAALKQVCRSRMHAD
uniref:Uncharacterized protein n=1 Tax=Knipowitschia caucasica TaxID=637954 RepID=A0AAV2KIC6_KNICA